MLIRVVLAVFGAMRGLIRLLRVDDVAFLAILEAKLTLDTRRQGAHVPDEEDKKSRNRLATTLIVNTIMGFGVAVMILALESTLLAVTVLNTFVMIMVAMTLIADFSSVLLDTTDNSILLPRPVSGRTMLAARIAHILTYLFLISMSLSVGAAVVGAIRIHPLFPLVFALTTICLVAFVLFVVNVLYLTVLRFATGEKFRDVILYVQIAVTIAIVGGYQFFPRLLAQPAVRTLDISDRWWIYISPPTWLAGPVELLVGQVGTTEWVLSLLAIVIPAGGLLTVLLVLAPRFNRAIAHLDDTASGTTGPPRSSNERSLPATLARLVSRSPVQRCTFELVWTLCSRDRAFKQRTYPALAFLVIIAFFMMMKSGTSMRESLSDLGESSNYFFVLYIGSAFLAMVISQLKYSAHHAASWVYQTLPIDRPGEILMGALKVILIRFALPWLIVLWSVCLAVWGGRIVPDLALAGSVLLTTCVWISLTSGCALPFSESFRAVDASGRFGRGLVVLLVPAILGGTHFLLKKALPSAILVGTPVTLAAFFVLGLRCARTDWATLARHAARN